MKIFLIRRRLLVLEKEFLIYVMHCKPFKSIPLFKKRESYHSKTYSIPSYNCLCSDSLSLLLTPAFLFMEWRAHSVLFHRMNLPNYLSRYATCLGGKNKNKWIKWIGSFFSWILIIDTDPASHTWVYYTLPTDHELLQWVQLECCHWLLHLTPNNCCFLGIFFQWGKYKLS